MTGPSDGAHPSGSLLTELKCVSCGLSLDPSQVQTVCPECGSMLSSAYDYDEAGKRVSPSALKGREPTLWRYRELLPVRDRRNIVSLGEGFTPLVVLREGLAVKDEGLQPTGTFKARGMSVAVSKAKELGLRRLAVPSAGNAGAALACYAAAAGLGARVYMPVDSPPSTAKECRAYGSELVTVEGNISDAARRMAKDSGGGYFDMSTLKEPYRLEGKKTMGYEVAEQTEFDLPDVIVYPTGGGTGLLGMWKAFGEMERMGWTGSKRPRMVSVQSEACMPVVAAFAAGRSTVDAPAPDAPTVASGLRVPKPFAAKQILEVLRESKGTAIAVSEGSILSSMKELARRGIFACPEGGAALAAYDELVARGAVARDERTLLFNTGTGLKYLGLYE